MPQQGEGRMSSRLLTEVERRKIRDDWFKSLPRGDKKLPKDLELEAQDAKTREITLKEVVPLLEEAKGHIKTWHNMGVDEKSGEAMWELYQHSPEMKRLNSAIEALKRGEPL